MRMFGAIKKRLTFVKFERFASVRNMPRPPCWSPEVWSLENRNSTQKSNLHSKTASTPTHENTLAVGSEVNCVERNLGIQ